MDNSKFFYVLMVCENKERDKCLFFEKERKTAGEIKRSVRILKDETVNKIANC